MASFELTPTLKETINASSLTKDQKQKLLSHSHLTHADLIKFYQTCHPTSTLLQLIQQTKLYIPPYNTYIQPKTSEFIKQWKNFVLKPRNKNTDD